MKKIFIITLFFILIPLQNTFAEEYKLTPSDKLIVNKLSSKIQKLLDTNNLFFRLNIENKINEIQEKYKTNKKMFSIFEEIKINTHLNNYKNEYLNHYSENNINYTIIKNNWLNWHNKARSDLWRKSYTYDERLNSSAYEWSVVQQNNWIMNHKRESWDIYYDYKKIEKWFNSRWIICNIAGWATTSESVWKYWYYCNDNECTDELSKSLKEIFNIYMTEKWLWYPADAHYKWIVHINLSKIWLWINIKENFTDTYWNYRSYDYYVTTHYCTTFKK